MRENGWLIGYGMATAVYDVPALERVHAATRRALGLVMPASLVLGAKPVCVMLVPQDVVPTDSGHYRILR
jgi:hypothetical protein